MHEDAHIDGGEESSATEVVAIYLTFPNETVAIEVAEALLERRLVACVNVLGAGLSLYRWDGVVQREREAVAVAKTTRDRVAATAAAVVELHPYELPCVVAYPATGGLPPYLAWVADEADSG